MAVMNVNPTRMELSRIKRRLQVARRGYKLLKDKRDEMMKQFLEMAVKNKEMRMEVEQKILKYQEIFVTVLCSMEEEALEEALMLSKASAAVETPVKNVLGVEVPEFRPESGYMENLEFHPYGYAFTCSELDNSTELLKELLPDMIKLAGHEKMLQLVSEEIEKTRRRVSALEYILIPQLEETVKYIIMKLEENERGNITRLMKVKDLMLKRSKQDINHG